MGRPLKFETVAELETKIDAFFDHCKKENKNLTVEGLCVFLDCDKQTILNYQGKDGYSDVIDIAKLKIADSVMGRAMSGDINPTIAIWISKNHYGYKDKIETENTTKIQRYVIDSDDEEL